MSFVVSRKFVLGDLNGIDLWGGIGGDAGNTCASGCVWARIE